MSSASGGEGEPQVAWTLIDDGAEVLAGNGERVGRVSKVVGDTDADIFTGLAVVLRTLGKERFVEAERVTGIWPDRVQVDLEPSDIEALRVYEDVPVERWRPDPPSFWDRLFRRR
jgi:hypothetical protein